LIDEKLERDLEEFRNAELTESLPPVIAHAWKKI
jgi:hypothetical protein